MLNFQGVIVFLSSFFCNLFPNAAAETFPSNLALQGFGKFIAPCRFKRWDGWKPRNPRSWFLENPRNIHKNGSLIFWGGWFIESYHDIKYSIVLMRVGFMFFKIDLIC